MTEIASAFLRAAKRKARTLISAARTMPERLRSWMQRLVRRTSWRDLILRLPQSLWSATTGLLAFLYSIIVKLPWVIAVVVIVTIIIQGLTQHTTVIKPISVPKNLVENGYTAEVAGQRLRDAMNEFTENLQTRMLPPDISLSGDLPTIVVPTVGISLDAVVSSIRTLLRSTRSRTISGELTIKANELWLDLRIDSRKFYSSKKGAPIEKPDELFAVAAPDVMRVINPYYVAVNLRENKPDAALTMIAETILKLTPGDDNIPWLYNLRGGIYRERKDFPAAMEAFEAALRIDPKLVVAHVNIGNVYYDQNLLGKAIAKYTEAIRLDPKYALAHANYANALDRQGRRDEGLAEHLKAVELEPLKANQHYDLGVAYVALSRNKEAIAAYRRAIEINALIPKYHNNLGVVLDTEGDSEQAVAEYRKAAALDSKYVLPHNNLAFLLRKMRKFDEAEAVFRAVIAIDPKVPAPHFNLADLFNEAGKADMAIAEYKEALRFDSNSQRAKEALVEIEVLSNAGKKAETAATETKPNTGGPSLASPPSPP